MVDPRIIWSRLNQKGLVGTPGEGQYFRSEQVGRAYGMLENKECIIQQRRSGGRWPGDENKGCSISKSDNSRIWKIWN